MNHKKLIVMKGLPGAGKSTFLDRLQCPPVTVCSADHHFIQADGSYKFDPKQIGAAHTACFRKFSHLLEAGTSPLAVDNTNLSWWEMSRYVEAGLAAGYNVEVIDLQVAPAVAASRNVHGVPAASIDKMAKKSVEVPANVKSNPAFRYTIIP